MSQTLTLANIENLVAAKVPLNLQNNTSVLGPGNGTVIDDRIFEAYRWIEDQGNFLWNVVNQDITVRSGNFFVNPADMPGGSLLTGAPPIDIGRPIMIYGSSTAGYVSGRTPIPYISPDKIGLHQLYHVPSIKGFFSCFTIATNSASVGFLPATGAPWPSNVPYILFAPSSANVTADSLFHCFYHQQVKMNYANFTSSGGTTNFFPTPDAFDDLIVNLAVAFIKEMYNLTGGDNAIKKAQAQTSQLLDRYRSDKIFAEGLMAESSQAQETQVKGASGV